MNSHSVGAIFVENARHVGNHTVFLRFNDGTQGQIDLRDVIDRYAIAAPLKDPVEFSKFHLDSWPTLCWDCGFDIAPEALHRKVLENNGTK
jgi:hypothetical protein